MLEIGSVIDEKYKILNVIGKGGMSTVYLAMNEKANRQWAIKEIRKTKDLDLQLEKNEIELMKRLDHPHLPKIADVIEREDSMLIVMDYIEGRSLEELYVGKKRVSQEQILDFALQLCDVLSYLHAQDPPIIYRDMKPANVMLRPDGRLMLIDFGAAREYLFRKQRDTVLLGTKGYAAPEQYRLHGQSDGRTDIYCLGVMLFELLTGEPPCHVRPVREIRPELSSGLEAIISKCTKARMEDRYQSCQELSYALSHYWELEESYGKKQKKKLLLCMLPVMCTLAFGVSCGVFFGMEWFVRNSNYELRMQAANYETDKKEAVLQYERAMSLDSEREDAYAALLERVLLEDDRLTKEESEQLRAVLLTEDMKTGKTREQFFRKNKEGYGNFAYESGIAYFYKFEEKSNKKNAEKYFSEAVSAGLLSEDRMNRAKILKEIASYYARIGVIDQAGDEKVTYGMYWKDLRALLEGNLLASDNERTAMTLYEELVSQVTAHLPEFVDAGVSLDEMLLELSFIEAHLETDFENLSEKRRKLIQGDLDNLKEQIRHAKVLLKSYEKNMEVE